MPYSDTYNFDPTTLPDIHGKWLNKNTGEVITVRDAMLSDNGIVVRCSNNNTIDMNKFTSDYVQATDDVINDLKGQSIESANVDDEFAKAFNEEIGDIKLNKKVVTKKKEDNSKNTMIDKVFTKLSCSPGINVSINWDKFPKEELNMLITFFDVTKEDIAQYICNNYVNMENVNAAVAESLDL